MTMPTSVPTGAAPTPRPPPSPRRRWGVAVFAAITLPVTLAGLALAWVLFSEPGTAWLLARVPGLQITGPRGSLGGGAFGAERVRVTWAGGQGVLELRSVQWRGARWQLGDMPGSWATWTIDSFTVQQVVVTSGPPSTSPLAEPSSLRLPLGLEIRHAQVAELRVDSLDPMHALAAAVHLGAQGGRQHRLSALQFDWDRVHVEGGRLQLDADSPFALEAALDARARSGTPWQAQVQAGGALGRIALKAQLRGDAPEGQKSPPEADARMELRPFAAWPLGTLAFNTRALDLSALSSQAPVTRLDGHATVASEGARAPWTADIELVNTLPGRWDQNRLPLKSVRASVRTDRAHPSRVDLPSFDLRFADGVADAGRWQGQGSWDGTQATLDSRFTDLRVQRLDGRAAVMSLSGPWQLRLRGLPSPDAPAATAGQPNRWDRIEGDFTGRIEGTPDRAPEKVLLEFDGRASRSQFELRSLRASAGETSAAGTALLRLGPAQRWQFTSEGRLNRFDPVPWFPGPEGSAWRRGPHRLTAQWTLDLTLPDRALRLPPLQWLQTLQGDGEVRLLDSRIAGVPAEGQLLLQRDLAAPVSQRSRARGELRLGRNRLAIQASGDPAGRGEGDRWQLTLDAPAVAELAPLFALDPLLAAWKPRRGMVAARLAGSGRWPDLRAEGEATVQGVQAGELSLTRGRAVGRMDLGAARSVDVQLDIGAAALGSQKLDALRAQVRGTLASHRINADLTAPVQPPALLEQALGLRGGTGTQLILDGEGGWIADAGGGGTWRGRVHRLSAGSGNAASAATASAAISAAPRPAEAASPPVSPVPDATWLDAADLQGEFRFDAGGRLVGVSTPSGRATLAGGAVLRWSDIRWRADPGHPDFTVQAEIEPMAVAPVLQRLQPGGRNAIQWGGDLRVSARLDVRAGERFDAEVALRRHDGDLSFSDGGTPQWLGLTDVDFTLAAHDGVWQFTPLFVGRMLGAISGSITAKAPPQSRWPGSEAELEGAVGLQVPSLAVWTGWLPPGWRIEGTMAATARLAGTLGAPQYTGELQASGVGLRNLLQGVALNDGELRVVLEGDTARVERLSIRGGDGTLTATGRATFGSAPEALLEVDAERFRILARVDRQLVMSGHTALSLQADRLKLDGRLGVDSGLFDLSARDAPSLDDDVNVVRAGDPVDTRAEPASVPRLMRNAAVALDIDLGRQLRLRGRGLDTLLAGQLKLSAPGGRLALNGTVRAESGTYAAYGQKLEIERGFVTFAGPVDGARLDILALRPNLDVRVGVAIAGTALNPRVRLYSEPDMNETDKLSWLVLGRGPDGLGRTDTALLQRAALALLAGEGGGPTDSLMRAIGLDDLSVRQSDGEVRETVITLGKQISRRWYVGYERGVNATAGTWQLIYRIAQRFTLRAQSGLDTSLDVIWTWRFGKP